jgi:chromate transport protein chrA
MALLMLLYFIKIGAFTFGSGWSIIAQMEREFVDERGWMTRSDLLELIAVGKSLPGIMVANITLLFGYQMAGALGGICAAIGLCIPAVVTLTIVTAIYDAIKDNYWVWSALKGVQCAVAPIIGGAAISLGKDALTSAMPILICAIAFVLCYFTSISNLTLVAAGVVIALVWMGVSEHGHV